MSSIVIKLLESDNSRLFKEDVIKQQAEADHTHFFTGCRMALDSLFTFGVKQVPQATKDGPGLNFGEFFYLAQQLNQRELTGHDARDAILEAMEKSTMDEWNYWYRRILIKDLRCGVSEKTVNNVIKKLGKRYDEYKIPVFTCMLAHDSANHEKKMVGKKFLDTKLDGVRVITIYNDENDTVSMYSRNGKELHNFGHIAEEILNTVASTFKESMVLDGEVVSDTFQDLMKQVHRKSNVNATDARLALFDMLTLNEFQSGKSELGCADRHKQLVELGKNLKEDSSMFVLEKIQVDLDTDEGQKTYTELNKKAVAEGYEGIMIKDIDAPYECKRSHHMLKAKPFIEVSLEVVKTEEGTGRNVGKLGALVCQGTDDGKDILVNVGSGLSDVQRETFWKTKDRLIGMIAEVRADAVTQNQDDSYSLRFPRFKTFRGFEQGEKI
jgi:DNA ligase-1